MATTATYYYCDPDTGLQESKVVTMIVGAEAQYYDEVSGKCRIVKKRRKITMTITGSVPVPLIIRYEFLYTYENLYSPDEPDSWYQTDYITIPAYATSAFEYVDTRITTTCQDEDGIRDSL